MRYNANLKTHLFQQLRNDEKLLDSIFGMATKNYLLIQTDAFYISESLKECLRYTNVDDLELETIFPQYNSSICFAELNNLCFKDSSGSSLNFKFKLIELDRDLKEKLYLFCLDEFKQAKDEQSIKDEIARIAKLGTWEVDLLNKKITWDSVVKEIHGVDESFEPSLDVAIEFYKEGKSRDKISMCLRELIVNKKEFDVELQIVTAKQEDIWVRAIGKGIFENGNCVKIFGIFQNVDETHKWVDEIQERDARFSLAKEAAQLGIWDLDPISGELIWDDQMFNLYGLERKDFKGVYEAWESAIHPEDKARGAEEIALALSGKRKFDTEFRVIHSNGEIRHIKALAKTVLNIDGACVRLIGTNWDITEFKKASYEKEKALKKLEDILSATTNVSIISTDINGMITSFNKGAENILGYTAKEVVGLSTPVIFHSEQELIERSIELSNEYKRPITGFEVFVIKANEENADVHEWTYIHKSGVVKTVQLIITVMRDKGNIIGYLGVAVDISDLKRAQSEMSSLLTISDNQNRRLKNFAYIVSHNLRSYSTNFTMLLNIAGFKDVDLENEILPMLNDASKKLDEAINHLNEVATINIEEKPLVPLCVNSLVSKIILEKKPELSKINAKIDFEPKTEFYVLGVEEYFLNTIRNLIDNSIKFRDLNKTLHMKIKICSQMKKVSVEIEDNGIGIDLVKNSTKIFGLYKTFHEVKDSRGAGLFIIKNQIEAMQGTINLESQPNLGTKVNVVLNEQI